MRPTIDLNKGDVFGRLTVLGMKRRETTGHRYWECRCLCGKIVRASSWDLRSGSVQSCGCQKRDKSIERCTTHGGCRTSEYSSWSNMISRCECKNSPYYKHYGGRGIVICKRWRKSFAAFLEDMGPKPSPKHELDRYPNNDGNYEPKNCRWATRKEQLRNMRITNMATVDGQTKSVAEWSEISGVNRKTITSRIQKGWTAKDAIFTKAVYNWKGVPRRLKTVKR